MQTAVVEANLVRLNEEFKLAYVPDLIQRKLSGREKSVLGNADIQFYQQEYNRLLNELEQAAKNTWLPDTPSGKDALNHLLLQLRMHLVKNQ